MNRWIVKTADGYLQTLHWLIVGQEQSLAIRFDDRVRARKMARRLMLCDPDAKNVRVVRLVDRMPKPVSEGDRPPQAKT
jgi:hypothetical protein